MHDVYSFVTGPMVWLAFAVFIGGSLYRLGRMLYLIHKKEKFIFTYMSWKYSLRSIFHWMIPFATVNWKRHPVLTIVTHLSCHCTAVSFGTHCSLGRGLEYPLVVIARRTGGYHDPGGCVFLSVFLGETYAST